jgi:hypothetical protein
MVSDPAAALRVNSAANAAPAYVARVHRRATRETFVSIVRLAMSLFPL